MKKILSFICFCSVVGIAAQDHSKKKDTVKTEVVEIETRYNPKIADANKIVKKPTIKILEKSKRKKLVYSIFSAPVASTFVPKTGVVKGIDVGVKERIFNNFVALGYGNYASPYTEMYFHYNSKFENDFGLHVKYSGSQENLRNSVLNSTFSNIETTVFYSQNERFYKWKTYLSAKRNSYNWYGLPDLNFSTLAIGQIEEQQNYNQFNLGGEISFEDSKIEIVKFDLQYFTDAWNSSELYADGSAIFKFPVDFLFRNSNEISISTQMEYLRGRFQQSYSSDAPLDHHFLTLNASPRYKFKWGAIAIDLGTKLFLSFDIENDLQHFLVYPDVNVQFPIVKDFVPVADMENLVFGGWDINDENVYDISIRSEVLDKTLLDEIKPELENINVFKAVFDKEYVRRLEGDWVKTGSSKMDLAEQVMDDIKAFNEKNDISSNVMIWCGSTEIYFEPSDVHSSIEKFEEGLRNDSPDISPSMIYAYAAIKLGIPYANGAPNLSADIPALIELAEATKTPIAGKDFKTGQTLMKTILAPGLKARQLGISGWFSTNILGNRDGEVLDDPDAFKTKEESKLGVLDTILEPEKNPDLYSDIYHKVRINYYPPRGDDKEGWDNIDIFGWLGYPMQIKVDFLCRDSILAAPIVLDLILFLDLAKKSNMSGIQEWLSFYFKSPMALPGLDPEHDIFVQLAKLKNTLRHIMGEELITHLGQDK